MNGRPLLVVGAGGHGRVVADAALSAGRIVSCFVDARPSCAQLLGAPVEKVATDEIPARAAQLGADVIVAIGDNRTRQSVQQFLQAARVPLAVVAHPSSVVAASASLGAGAVLLARTVVGVDALIGEGAIINTGAQVDHDCQIGAFCHLSPAVALGGEVVVGEGTHLAVGVRSRNRIRIGAWSVVGVGAAVVKDIPDRVVAYGVPARVVAALE